MRGVYYHCIILHLFLTGRPEGEGYALPGVYYHCIFLHFVSCYCKCLRLCYNTWFSRDNALI